MNDSPRPLADPVDLTDTYRRIIVAALDECHANLRRRGIIAQTARPSVERASRPAAPEAEG